MKSQLSFRMRLQLILLTVSLAAIGLLAVTSYQSATAFRVGKETQLRISVEGMMDKIDRNLFERYGDAQAFALSEAARSGNPSRITEFINDMMTTYAPVYDLMMVVDHSGKVVAVSTKSKGDKPLDSRILLGTDVSKTAWFKAAVSGKIKPGTTFVENLYIDESVAEIAGTSGKVMSFSAPIVDKSDGRVLGVWSNRMSWADVVEAIAKEEAAKIKSKEIASSFPYIVDSRGNYLLTPDGQDFDSLKPYPVATLKAARIRNPDVRVLDLATTEFGGRVLEAIMPSKGYASYPGKAWTAILQIPEYDRQTEFNRNLIIFGLILIALANIMAFMVIRRMSGSFETVVRRMTAESGTVRLAADHISSASQQLSESTSEQAAAIEETAASMEEITSMVVQTTQNAGHCKAVSEEGQIEAKKGKEVIAKMATAMEDIKASNSQLDQLVEMIDVIRKKTEIINDIVNETRLLSFNASIEAARAGVHGKGFAVVAEEVGKLAGISGKAADEIRDLLDSSASEVSHVVKSTQERVLQGQNISEECKVAFAKMDNSLERVNDLIATIAVAAKEQEAGVKQTNRAISEMDKVTQNNSRGAEVLAAQAETLFSGAQSLNGSIDHIRLVVVGHTKAEDVKVSESLATKAKGEHPAVQHGDSGGDSVKLGRGDSRWKSAS